MSIRGIALSVCVSSGLLLWPLHAFGQSQAFHPGDVNCDSLLNSVDIIYLVNYIFRSGSSPCNGIPSGTGATSPRIPIAPALATSAPGGIDTLRMDRLVSCDPSADLTVGIYLHNHDPLLNLTIPLRIETESGGGFVHFDSLVWGERIRTPDTMDLVTTGRIEVNGSSPDWVAIVLLDLLGGVAPLDSGSGYLCHLFFTPLSSEGDVGLYMGNSGIQDTIGPVEFVYEALQFDLHLAEGHLLFRNGAGTGDVNCDTSITSADIILLVNLIFKSGS